MVPFAGYDMPVQYPTGILKEHLHTAPRAGFVRHLAYGQAFLSAAIRRGRLERVTPGRSAGLKEGCSAYGLLLNDEGGIKDDFMTTRLRARPALIWSSNAATKEADFAYIAER